MATCCPTLPIVSFGSVPPPTPSSLPTFPTVVLPNPSQPLPPLPAAATGGNSLATSLNFDQHALPDLSHLARTVLAAKKVAVVCGAGISTASGIPDFRSTSGLFESLKHKYPDAKLSSGKDLFDVGLFSSEQNAAIFYNMIAELRKQTDEVEPTKFHHWLKSLDDDGKLFRVYTQNIDSLEERAGLSYGLGSAAGPLPPRSRSPTKKKTPVESKSPTPELSLPSSSQTSTASSTASSLGLRRSDSTSSLSSLSSLSSSCSDSPPTPISPPSHSSVPRCIPLHGHLATLSCALCSTTYPLPPYLSLLSNGQPPLCPSCTSLSESRLASNRRSLGIGYLKPDVVLYGEHHRDGERIGEITRKDLMGARPDLLIVVGTSLKVPGTKKLVKELSKVIKPLPASTSATGARKGKGGKKDKISTIFLNQEFPGGGKEWMGVFDCWVRGDIQEFVDVLDRERVIVDEEKRVKEEARANRAKGARPQADAVKVKNAKLPARPKARAANGPDALPPVLPVVTTTATTKSKRPNPPTPTKSPTRAFYVDVAVAPPNAAASNPISTPTKSAVLKRPRRSSPVLVPLAPSVGGVDGAKPTTTMTRRSGRTSTALAASDSAAVAKPVVKKPNVGMLGFASSKPGAAVGATTKPGQSSLTGPGSDGGRTTRTRSGRK